MPKKLGEILVDEGACTPDDLRDALKNQIIFGGRLGTNLLELVAVSEDALASALGRQHGVPALSGELRPDPAATALLRPEIADRHDAVPYLVSGRRMGLLVVDPRDLAMLDEVAFATGKSVHPIVAPEARIWALLRRTYGIDRHLRGIDVDFAKIRAERDKARSVPDEERVAGAAATAGQGDLMEESAFQALYTAPAAAPPQASVAGAPPPQASAAAAPPPPPPAAPPRALDDDVLELTDLLEPEAPAAPPPAAVAPEVLAALSGPGGHAPPPRLVHAPPERAAPEPSPLSFDEALRFLEGVDEREAIAKTVLRYARSKFARAVLLTIHRGAAHGWAGVGEKLGGAAVRHLHLALGSPGIVDTVVRTQAHFLGPIPKTEANIRLLKALGGGVPGNAFLVPILAMGRVVNVFYADAGRGAVLDAGSAGELLILATRIAKSYDTLLARVR